MILRVKFLENVNKKGGENFESSQHRLVLQKIDKQRE